MEPCLTYVSLLKKLEGSQENPKALNERHPDGQWISYSTQDLLKKVRLLALGLRQQGLQRGDKVAILAPSSPYWTIADLAIVLAGGITVPIFTTISEENFIYEVRQTKCKTIFVGGAEQWSLYRRYEEQFSTVIAFENDHAENSKIKTLASVLKSGEFLSSKDPDLYKDMLAAIRPSDVSTIIFTSGSTGVPKGVELTQENLISAVGFTEFTWNPKEDRYLSVLPLEHVFGHCFNIWMLYHGVSIYYSNDHKKLAQICSEVQPTMIAVVPRLLEKVYDKLLEKVQKASPFKSLIGRLAFHYACEPNSFIAKLLRPLFDKLVFSKIREALGGKVRMFISGGAALSPYLHNFYNNLGFPVYEGWGLSEACPLSTNTPIHCKANTVGRPLPGHEIKISPEGEILAKGPLVMRGYYDDAERTALTIDSQGYLHTGDKGFLDEEGYIHLVGRLKELYKSSSGEYIAPVPIEQAISRHQLIEMALVIAEGRKFTSVLLFPNHEVLAMVKKSQGGEEMSDEQFLDSTYVHREMNHLLQEVNRHLNHPEQIRSYRFILEPLTIKGGELTPSMKIRREKVLKKYAHIIEDIYRKGVIHHD